MSNVFYVKIIGAEGPFNNEVNDPGGSPMTSLGLGFEYSVMVPLDAASGQASGRRQHSRVVFTKAWGAASPQLFQALVRNRTLPTVQFDFYSQSNKSQPNKNDSLVPFYRITLSQVLISKIEQYENFNVPGHDNANDDRFLEDVSLAFQAIDIEHIPTGTLATDSMSVD